MRNSFLASVLIALFLPIYTIFFTYPTFNRLLTANTEEAAIRIGTHLATMVGEADVANEGPLQVSDELKTEAAKVARDFKVMKYRVFAHTGELVYSSVASEIGRMNEKEYFHQIVAQGGVFTKTVAKEGSTMEGETFKMDVVETYVPILREGRFVGAFEIYFDITAPKGALDEAIMHSSAVLIIIGGGFLFLMLLVRRSVVGPISHVTQAMNHMAQGNYDERVPVMGKDEISDMARIFNQMGDQLKRSHAGLHQEKKKLTTILLSAREGIVVTDPKNRVVLANPSAQRLLGKDEKTIFEEGFHNLIDDADFVTRFLETSGVGMPETIVFNQHVLQFYASTIHSPQDGRIGSAALIRDVTEEKKLEDKLRELSHTDGLTGLLNRRRLDEILAAEFQRAKRYGTEFGILLFDVDHFKKFNDEHGHDQGDRVLQALAHEMKDHFRSLDYCCRFGGEEFCIIMPSTITPGIMDAADRFRVKVANMLVDGLQVTISIGIAIFSQVQPEKGPQGMIKLADEALYAAKQAGRNRVKFFPL
ncbi:MAG: diguanylate cyclase [Magnetococcales bacterium]|nr:diguanylate cyclase [Magnetococcales bacterium]